MKHPNRKMSRRTDRPHRPNSTRPRNQSSIASPPPVALIVSTCHGRIHRLVLFGTTARTEPRWSRTCGNSRSTPPSRRLRKQSRNPIRVSLETCCLVFENRNPHVIRFDGNRNRLVAHGVGPKPVSPKPVRFVNLPVLTQIYPSVDGGVPPVSPQCAPEDSEELVQRTGEWGNPSAGHLWHDQPLKARWRREAKRCSAWRNACRCTAHKHSCCVTTRSNPVKAGLVTAAESWRWSSAGAA